MNLRSMLFLAIAIGLWALSRSLELHGDIAPLPGKGVATERLQYHLMALVALLGALAAFVYAGVSAFRR